MRSAWCVRSIEFHECVKLFGDDCSISGFNNRLASIAFQMAEVAIPRQTFQEILRLIAELRPKPPPTPA
jgi:hypothetical protein